MRKKIPVEHKPSDSSPWGRLASAAAIPAIRWVWAIAVVAALGSGGCRTVQGLTVKPKVQAVSVAVSGFDLRQIALRFDVELLNPGDGELNVLGYDYALHVEGRSFAAGASRDGFVLAPRGAARVAVPVVIALADLGRVLAALDRRGEASYRLAVSLLIDTPVGAFRFPLEHAGCVRAYPPAVHPCTGPP
jgi:LEA14-like dessication related protein